MAQGKSTAPAGFVSPATLAGLPLQTPVLLGLSGGADSRLLLHLLAQDAKEKHYRLTLAHVNHQIRGEDALRDRAFCETLAVQYGLELCVLDADVPRLAAERGMGLEETGRAVRYDYFAKLMAERGIPILATAHHADDNLETVIFRLARGTGLTGLCGIAPCRRFADGYLTRPILGMSKQKILGLCAEYGLQFVIDETNAEPTAARNRIRAEVTPLLEQLFDDPQSRVYHTSEGLREDDALLRSMADELLAAARVENNGLSLDVLANAPKPLRRRVLAMWCRECTDTEPERVHLEALEHLVTDGAPRETVALPHGVSAFAEMGVLRAKTVKPDAPADFYLPLSEGVTVLESGIRISVEKYEKSSKVHSTYTQSCIMVCECLVKQTDAYYWRPRREGDLLLTGGMHKKIRRLYREAGISVRLRERMPLLCDKEGIVWAPFAGVRDGKMGDGDAWLVRVELPTETV